MRKLCLLFVSFAALGADGCATLKDIGRAMAVRGASAVPTVSFPALDVIGYKIYPDAGLVRNNSPLYCAVTAFDVPIAALAPGNIALGSTSWAPFPVTLPLVAKCYRDPEYRTYVAGTWAAFDIAESGPSPFTWVIETENLVTPDNAPLVWNFFGNVPIYPLPDADLRVIPVKYPLIRWNATTAIQSFNNTHFEQVYQLNGKHIGTVAPTEIWFYRLWNRRVDGVDETYFLHVSFVDRGRLVGIIEYHIAAPASGVHTVQLVPNPGEVRTVQ